MRMGTKHRTRTSARASRALLLLAMAALLLTASCAPLRTGAIRTERESLALDGAETVRVDLLMGAGELLLGGGAEDLMDAEFVYNVPRWRPTVDYQVTGAEGVLEVRQPEVVNVGWTEDYRYTWDVQLNEDVPLALDVRLGAGEGTLRVADLTLTRLDLRAGAGKATVDLAGRWAQDVDVSIEAGVGEVLVTLPAETGARVTVEGALGEVEAEGLRVADGAYVNDAYGETETGVSVAISGGVGRVTLQVAE